MKIQIEKKPIVGVVQAGETKYNLLDLNTKDVHLGNFTGSTRFHVIDDEGFDTYAFIHGAYTVIVNMVPEYLDVRIVLQDEEAQDLDKNELFSDEINPSPTN